MECIGRGSDCADKIAEKSPRNKCLEESVRKINDRMQQMEKEMAQLMEKLTGLVGSGFDGTVSFTELVDKVKQIEREMDKINEQINAAIDEREDQAMQNDVNNKQTKNSFTKISSWQFLCVFEYQLLYTWLSDKIKSYAQALLEQIEMVKTTKADKEDVVDALAEKADAQVVNTKVSFPVQV